MVSSILTLTLLIFLTPLKWGVYGQVEKPTQLKPCEDSSMITHPTTISSMNSTSATTVDPADNVDKCWTKGEYEKALISKTLNKKNDVCVSADENIVQDFREYLLNQKFKFPDNYNFSGVSEKMISQSCNRTNYLHCVGGKDKCDCVDSTSFNETLNVCQVDNNTAEEEQMEVMELFTKIENITGWQSINESCNVELTPTFDRRIHGYKELGQLVKGVLRIKDGLECLFTKNLVCQSLDNLNEAGSGNKNGTCQCPRFTQWKPEDESNPKNGACAAEDGKSCEIRISIRSRRVAILTPCLNDDANCTSSHEDNSNDFYFVCCIPGMTESEDDICMNGQPEVAAGILKIIIGILSGLIWSGFFFVN